MLRNDNFKRYLLTVSYPNAQRYLKELKWKEKYHKNGQEYMKRDPDNINFTVLALTAKMT